MSIKEKMKPAFQKLEGGLFSSVDKADVGDALTDMQKRGVALMSWADPFAPDPSIPKVVLDKAIEVLKGGFPSHYIMPIGSLDLKKAIAKRLERKYEITVDPARNIIINPGSDVGLMFAMAPFIGPEDEVLVHDPSYPSNFLNPELLGGVTVKVPTYEEDNYHLRIEEYEKRLTPKTKMVLISSPNNPTGTAFTRKELEELSAFIVKNDLICVSDQAFEDTVFAEHEMVNIATLPGMWERTLTVCSVSKGMGLSGFRVGWIYADDVIMDVLYGSAVNIQGATNTMAQMSVLPAVENDDFIQDYMIKYDNRRKYAYNVFNSIPGVSMNMPEAGFYSWINISKLGDSSEIVKYLTQEALVNCNDGKYYGEQGKGHLRLIHGAFLNDEDSFAAIDRMGTALRKLAKTKGFL